MTYELRCEQRFPSNLTETFEFFKNPANLARITPSGMNFVIKTKDVTMRRGAEIDYTIRWLGLPLGWKTRIAEYDPPFHFVDVQEKGPYRHWRHSHRFQAIEDGTLVIDVVRYELPFGVLGQIGHALMVRRQLEEIFRYRQQALSAILGRTGEAAAPVIQEAAL